ncbi:periplasmic heavy metal sensor [Pararhodobacter zhoushanensis]|uniref:Periplasmic heavy metal sensor n=1 Tax=Pararhodobacter zhoushanensis TaxID=2479545 RepID=A0ABT3GYD7_9RHOB|nr:periplasmic heavy metal sensor [Pararhodobacter zhoushanensis]MCW1932551.1 periplasmic heavy metal sensor [Pararhodobacter zhoushanensis]
MSDLTPTPATPRLRKPGRGLRIALVLSLMVNLLVVGVLVGGAMRASRMDGFVPGQPDMRALWWALPDDSRDALRASVNRRGMPGDHGHRPSREERRARNAELNARMLAGLRADPFDPQAFATVMAGDRDERARRLDTVHADFAAQVAQLTPEQRRAMADRFEEGLRRHDR